MRILIVEDEYNLADVISSRLKKEKYLVDISEDGEEGSYNALTGIYDLVILDVMLPYKDGFTILKEMQDNHISSKIIMLTAKSTIEDKLDGLTNGADDYITKPFHIEELVARVNIQLKKVTQKENGNKLQFHDIELDAKNSKLICTTNNENVELVCKEFQLLEYFLSNPEQILSKEQIYDKIWGLNRETESNNLEVYLSFIRKKLKAIDSEVTIKSSRGLGYKIEVQDE